MCVSDAIKALGETLGLAIGITLAVLAVLIIILCILVKWKEEQVKRQKR